MKSAADFLESFEMGLKGPGLAPPRLCARIALLAESQLPTAACAASE